MFFNPKNLIVSFFVVIIISLTACSQPQGTVFLSKKFSSKILNQTINYSIYLPPLYTANSTMRFPVLYLLHGFDGDETSWVVRSNVAHLADSLIGAKAITQFIIVMPDARNSYYINNFDKSFPFEDFFTDELIPFINKNYRTNSNSKREAICGLSMGGFGALIIPIKHPELFGTSIALSAAVRTPDIFIQLPQTNYQQKFAPVFGDSLKGTDRITPHWKENSPYFIIDSTNADTLKQINWYIDCGMQDFLFSSNDAFHDLLIKYGIAHEFHMRIGEHNWNYWHDGFINGLVYLGKKWR